jgi:5-formyltetrahydrofolate cyclo-ligase
MTSSIPRDAKAALRSRVRAVLAHVSPEEAAEASARACALLRTQSIWIEAKSVLFYAPLAFELDVSPLMTEALVSGKMVALPRFLRETAAYAAFQVSNPVEGLARGNYGILEPISSAPSVPLNQLDLALVPGIAFDMGGRRLGRGKGFYDRLLAAVPGPKCGVAFDQQVVSEIPVESHDILMNFILTPTRWLAFIQSAA